MTAVQGSKHTRAPGRSLSLAGRTVLVTRTQQGNAIERAKLEKLGAKVVELPSIEIREPSSWSKADEGIGHIFDYDWVVFTSSNGVRAFFVRLRKNKGKRGLQALTRRSGSGGIKFACVGPATRKTLFEYGIRPALVPKDFLTSKLGEALATRFEIGGRRILLARAEVANREIAKALRKAGARVTEAQVYRTVPRKGKLSKALLDAITDVTLTSPSTVEGLLKAVRPSQVNSRQILVHCIGPVTAKRASDAGLKVHSVAKVHTLDGLIRSLLKQKKRIRQRVG